MNTILVPRMTNQETKLLAKYLSMCTNYVEFGCGGSTYMASRFANIENIYSIEASQEWVEKIKKNFYIKRRLDYNKLIIDYVDINGDDKNWSAPKNKSKIDNWKNYYNPWSKILFKPDVILVDGRFRVACILNALKNIDENCYILIHDYKQRYNYHIIEQFVDIIEKNSTLYVFKKKNCIDIDLLEAISKRYENDYS